MRRFKMLPSAMRKARESAPYLTTIVVTVQDDFDGLRATLERVLQHTGSPHELLIIDDGSTDARIWPLLESLREQHHHITCVGHKKPGGFALSANVGFDFAPGDVVLLQCGALIGPHWLEQLAATAYSRTDVGTVSALSSLTGLLKIAIDGATPERVAQVSARLRPVIPTACGPCVFIPRKALLKVGGFDGELMAAADALADFSLRGVLRELVNLADDATLVGSFPGSDASHGKVAGSAVMRRAPELGERWKAWTRSAALEPINSALKRDWSQPPGRLRMLHVTLPSGGGVRYHLEDLAAALEGEIEMFILETGVSNWVLYRVERGMWVPLRRWQFDAAWQYFLPLAVVRKNLLTKLIAELSAQAVHFQHLIGTGPDALAGVAALGVPVFASLHDYYTLCPTIQLLDDQKQFCAGKCTESPTDCELRGGWFRGGGPQLKDAFVHTHRESMRRALAQCKTVFTPSAHTADFIGNLMPGVPIEVVEYGRDLVRDNLATPPELGLPMRMVFFSDLGVAKGIEVVRTLLQLDRQRRQCLEIHLFGGRSRNLDDVIALGGKYHGPYQRDELALKLRAVRPSFSLIPSIWPETFCFTLGESWAFGLPVFCSDTGPLHDRVTQHGGGWLLDPQDPEAWYDQMLQVMESPGAWQARHEEALRAPSRPVADMAEQVLRAYRAVLKPV